jgi:hypothetical protein
MTDSLLDPDPCATISLSLPDERYGGPGSCLAKLRWHLAQTGFDGELAHRAPHPPTGPRVKSVVDLATQVGDAAPTTIVYLVSAAAVSGLVKIAGEWVRNQSKRITITAKRRDGSTIEIDAHNPPDLSRLIADLNGDPRRDDAGDD